MFYKDECKEWDALDPFLTGGVKDAPTEKGPSPSGPGKFSAAVQLDEVCVQVSFLSFSFPFF